MVGVNYVLETLQNGETFARTITFAEGLTSYQIVQRLNARDDLIGAIQTIPAEGSLMPDTYAFENGAASQSVIDRATVAMNQYLKQNISAKSQFFCQSTTGRFLPRTNINFPKIKLPL